MGQDDKPIPGDVRDQRREAEARRHEEKALAFREPLKYELRVVAFLDVLGWSHAVAASVDSIELTQKLGVSMQGLGLFVESAAWERGHGFTGSLVITHFSDLS